VKISIGHEQDGIKDETDEPHLSRQGDTDPSHDYKAQWGDTIQFTDVGQNATVVNTNELTPIGFALFSRRFP
jgi:hypothetical protein